MKRLYFILALFAPWFLVSALLAEVVDVEVATVEKSQAVPRETKREESEGEFWVGRFYLGGGVNYNFENLRGSLNNIDWDNTPGFMVKGGYFFSDYFTLEALFQYHHEFKHSESVTLPRWWYLIYDSVNLKRYYYKETAKLSGFDITINAKGYIPFRNFRPYGVIGVGYARGRLKVSIEESYHYGDLVSDNYYSDTETRWDFFGRAGIGYDLVFNNHVGVNAEVAYNMGFNDLDNIQFLTLSLGAFYLF